MTWDFFLVIIFLYTLLYASLKIRQKDLIGPLMSFFIFP